MGRQKTSRGREDIPGTGNVMNEGVWGESEKFILAELVEGVL